MAGKFPPVNRSTSSSRTSQLLSFTVLRIMTLLGTPRKDDKPTPPTLLIGRQTKLAFRLNCRNILSSSGGPKVQHMLTQLKTSQEPKPPMLYIRLLGCLGCDKSKHSSRMLRLSMGSGRTSVSSDRPPREMTGAWNDWPAVG